MYSDVIHASHSARMPVSWPPYVYMAYQELLMDVLFAQAERYLSKLTTSHFSTLNVDFTNLNVLKRIVIAMLNEKRSIGMRTSGYVQMNQ